MSQKRERVIIDVKSAGDAAKVEESVKTGYCDHIKGNLNFWTAIEEDIVDSYTSLAKKAGSESGAAFEELAAESRETLKTLRELLKSFEALSQQRTKRIQKIKSLKSS
jgi:hypothetical protein